MAVRVIGTHHSSSSAINLNRISQSLYRSSFPSSVRHYFSYRKRRDSDDSLRRDSDDSLLKLVESEIKRFEESNDCDQEVELPDGFPFEIEDKPGESTISLHREYRTKETIKVEVEIPYDLYTNSIDTSDCDDDDDGKSEKPSIPLQVSVCNYRGTTLEFECSAYQEKISIDSISLKKDQIDWEGPDFEELDEKMQSGLVKYLERRGVKVSNTNFLRQYMINKLRRDHLMWLKNMKDFIDT